jgi:pSer/pThr/pTyr-binding forkhead associated (FHA) protein
MAARLVPLESGPAIHVDKQIVVIGRSQGCDFVVESSKISRQHCCLAYVSQQLIARDLGSTNGIWKNGERVEETVLQLGDVLTIGDVKFRVDELGDVAIAPVPGFSPNP